MSQYSFYQSKKNTNNREINKVFEHKKLHNPEEVKAKILEYYDLYFQLLDNDHQLKYLNDEKTNHSNKILKFYQMLQDNTQTWTNDEINVINIQLNDATDLHKEANSKYHKYLESKLEWLKTTFPNIYEMITERDVPLQRHTLEHVLDVYCRTEAGDITRKEAINHGLNFMTDKFNLPKDFFDKSKVDQFISQNQTQSI